jgi:hypothetical protein
MNFKSLDYGRYSGKESVHESRAKIPNECEGVTGAQ